MHYHYYTLQHLSRFLNANYEKARVHDCFSQNKNELIFVLDGLFLRVGCRAPSTYIIPFQRFAKAKKNVIDLFPELIGLRLEGTRIVPYERVLIMAFEEGYELIFKMHNTKANAILRKEGVVISLFNTQQEEDLTYEESKGEYHYAALLQAGKETDWDEAKVFEAMRGISFIFERQYAKKVFQLIQRGKNFREAFRHVTALSLGQKFYLEKQHNRIKFYLFPPYEEGEETPFPVIEIKGIAQALKAFFSTQIQYINYLTHYRHLQKEIQKPFDKYQKVYRSYEKSIKKIDTQRSLEEIGHIIMANLHAIQPRSKQVELFDFYTNKSLKVKLKPDLNPQENAADYYERHKKLKNKREYLLEQMAELQEKMEKVKDKVAAFKELTPPKDLRFQDRGFDFKQLKALKAFDKQETKEQKAKDEHRYPFRVFYMDGYEIFVGKNAKNNDELSLKFAKKEDLWLHARDVTGSHVVIRKKPGQNFPMPVIEYAAGLAAYYSKRKNDSVVPVMYTEKKYIRKRKGDPPGLVVVSRDRTVMVEPIKA